MAKVTLIGTGHLNGSVSINKTVEIDKSMVPSFTGQKRFEAIEALLAVHFPGVKVNPQQIAVNIDYKD